MTDFQEAYVHKVIETFFDKGRLVKIPSQQKKLLVVLEELIQYFEFDRAYSEPEVNLILADVYDDFTTLRRDLIDFGFMTRSREGRNYRRVV